MAAREIRSSQPFLSGRVRALNHVISCSLNQTLMVIGRHLCTAVGDTEGCTIPQHQHYSLGATAAVKCDMSIRAELARGSPNLEIFKGHLHQ